MGSPFVFAQPDTLRRPTFGFHFILSQTRSTAKCRLAQTLGHTFSRPCSTSSAKTKHRKRVALAELQAASYRRTSKKCYTVRNKLARHEPARGIRTREVMCQSTKGRQAITASASGAAPRKSVQFVVKVSRRRTAPRSQSSGAAQVAQCRFIV